MRENQPHPKIAAVDLFCGIGGLTHGVRRAGITVGAGVDIEPDCRYAYETNNAPAEFIPANIREVKFSQIAKYYDNADFKVLMGCAPCQPFSAHTHKNKKDGKKGAKPPQPKDDDCMLIAEFARLVQEGDVDIVSMENVPGLRKHPEFVKFCQILEKMNFKVWADVVSCWDYGVPQKRRRLVLLASKLGEISLQKPKKPRKPTVADFIKEMPPVASGKAAEKDRFHISFRLSEKNLMRIQQSKPGGTWKDWDDDLICECHKNADKDYPSPYGRMEWNAAAPTITTQFCYYSTGRFGHPEQNRAITLREGALLQTFPRKYDFAPAGKKIIVTNLARHIGNAVPVNLAECIGKSIKEHIDNAEK